MDDVEWLRGVVLRLYLVSLSFVICSPSGEPELFFVAFFTMVLYSGRSKPVLGELSLLVRRPAVRWGGFTLFLNGAVVFRASVNVSPVLA